MKKIMVLSGGFDPVHAGHIAMIKHAQNIGDYLIVGVNSDAWLTRKKGQPFMPWHHRSEIIKNIQGVDEVLDFDDSDGSACDLLLKVKQKYPQEEIIFANGGDRTDKNIPEMVLEGFEFVFGIGGMDKQGSSSDFLRDWKVPTTHRPWGEYRVIYEDKNTGKNTKVKELIVLPGKSLSLQKHHYRNEYWHIVEGQCCVQADPFSPLKILDAHDNHLIPAGQWHLLSNPNAVPCKIIEIQFGSICEEKDIERRS